MIALTCACTSVAVAGERFAPPFGAGDVNGDGLADVVLTDEQAEDAVSAYVVFGSRDDADVDRRAPGARGFRISNLRFPDFAEIVGDVNGDGLADVAVTSVTDANRSSERGAVFVVFGTRDVRDVDVLRLGAAGVRIDFDSPRAAVLAAGDVDGDRLADVVVDVETGGADLDRGPKFVVFGRRRWPARVRGGERGAMRVLARNETLVSRAGDLNRDGRDDLLFADRRAGGCFEGGCEPQLWVVFGRRSTTTIDLARLGGGGIALCRPPTPGARDGIGSGASGLGDVDGDGRDDIGTGGFGFHVLLAPILRQPGCANRQRGRLPAQRTFRVRGLIHQDDAVPAGDLDGDGRADLAAHIGGERVFVLPGARRRGTVRPQRDGRLLAAGRPSAVGIESVEGVGDVNGDRVPDVVVHAFRGTPPTAVSTTFVVSGAASGPVDLTGPGPDVFEIR